MDEIYIMQMSEAKEILSYYEESVVHYVDENTWQEYIKMENSK